MSKDSRYYALLHCLSRLPACPLVIVVLALSTALLMRGWLMHALPSSPRQETLAELSITSQFLDDLRQGRLLPPWNPREFAGYPWLRFLAYPVYLGIAAVAHLGGIPLTGAMKGFFFLAFLGSGLAMYAYVRRLGLARAPAVLAALVYQWFPFHAHAGVETWIHAAFWALLPLALCLIERALAALRGRERYLWSLLVGALLACFVVVTIEYTLFAAPFVAIYLLAREAMLIRARQETIGGSLGRLVLMGAVAGGLAAFFVVPAVTCLPTVGIHNKHAAQSTFSQELLRGYSVTPSLVLGAVAKRLHLPLAVGEMPAIATAFWSVTWYPGVIASALALLGLLPARREPRLWVVAALLALALLIAVGPNLPGQPFAALPMLGRLMPWRGSLFAVAFASVLAGFGAQWLIGRLPAGAWRVALAGGLAALILVEFAPSASAFVGVERYFSPAEEAAQAWLRERGSEGDSRLWEPKALPRDDYRAILDVTRIGMSRFWGYYDNGAPLYTWQLFNWSDLATNLEISSVRFALLDEQVAALPGIREPLERAGFRPVDWQGQGLSLWEDEEVLPYARAYPVAALYIAERPEEALPLLPALHERGVALVSGESPYIDDYGEADLRRYRVLLADSALERQPGRKEAWLAQHGSRSQVPAALGRSPEVGDRVRWQRQGPGEVWVDVDLAGPAVVSIAESWYPHWQATVDGQQAPLLRVNYAFQGVWVAEGAHRVVFRYRRPVLDTVAAGVSVVTALALAGFVVYTTSRRFRTSGRLGAESRK